MTEFDCCIKFLIVLFNKNMRNILNVIVMAMP